MYWPAEITLIKNCECGFVDFSHGSLGFPLTVALFFY